jgi:hypothetical protein
MLEFILDNSKFQSVFGIRVAYLSRDLPLPISRRDRGWFGKHGNRDPFDPLASHALQEARSIPQGDQIMSTSVTNPGRF